MTRCFISLGGNLGPVAETFTRATELLGQHAKVAFAQISRNFQTQPVGENAGAEFWNAVAELETELPPLELLDLLQSVEDACGRTRELRWGPRTLDLDLVFYGDRIINLPRLQVPHPACWYRRFVLDPLAELAPDFVHPQRNLTVAQLRARMLARPFRMVIAGATSVIRHELIENLRNEFSLVQFEHWLPHEIAEASEPAICIRLPDSAESTIDPATIPSAARLDVPPATPDIATFIRDVLASAIPAER